ncbi:MAG: pyridoxine 5'-phosphate synthase [Candidatus Omnitrophota bacterium]|nr:pyridoxine 5'-phosphate synthase [Candidatus Omnitrophota bacterium]
MVKLGVNIDHIATLRQARKGQFPDPVYAASICEKAGCDSIVAHLREDRRHINDNDIRRLRQSVKTRFNLEMSISAEIVDIACLVKPHQATLVPEKRKELTTEGGLDILKQKSKIKKVVKKLTGSGIEISLFIDPDKKQISAVTETGAKIIELHTGKYAAAKTQSQRNKLLQELAKAASFAQSLGLTVAAGHGLDYNNAQAIAKIPEIQELNIGYSIICRGIFIGLETAVKEMLKHTR